MAERDDSKPDEPDQLADADDQHDELDDDTADEDDALSWEGDDELGRTTSLTDPRSASATRRPRSSIVDGRPLRDVELDDDAERAAAAADLEADLAVDGERPRRDPVRLLVTGVFAVVYLAFTVGWILAVQGIVGTALGSGSTGWVDAIARISQFLALVASALWFVTVVHLTRDARLLVRAGWMLLGTPLLLPWPYLMGSLL
ncbi:hypothetical protein GCM10027515_00240 [Schumannella luteola]|uniref:DNA polymerase III subunit gamma/tau n=1 Tax=Schumannella luteola TaxID=472059 RepID=A0A852Y799_9MICO|nr:hypothetical protein [Schumannella luteola]NYG98836.1 hypothetical protein [Schumannella luteola]TPW90723.1 hypothetical protein FJ656_36660 [Schumannella luteola]